MKWTEAAVVGVSELSVKRRLKENEERDGGIHDEL
jgi:hypothetical protein